MGPKNLVTPLVGNKNFGQKRAQFFSDLFKEWLRNISNQFSIENMMLECNKIFEFTNCFQSFDLKWPHRAKVFNWCIYFHLEKHFKQFVNNKKKVVH